MYAYLNLSSSVTSKGHRLTLIFPSGPATFFCEDPDPDVHISECISVSGAKSQKLKYNKCSHTKLIVRGVPFLNLSQSAALNPKS